VCEKCSDEMGDGGRIECIDWAAFHCLRALTIYETAAEVRGGKVKPDWATPFFMRERRMGRGDSVHQ